jgi:hypothetical protein
MNSILQKVDTHLEKYKREHKGEKPLYIIVSPYDSDQIFDDVRKLEGHAVDVLVTSYKDIKIIKHDNLNEGELQLSNELPETGS